MGPSRDDFSSYSSAYELVQDNNMRFTVNYLSNVGQHSPMAVRSAMSTGH